MQQLKVLISGAGIAGTSLAFWLTKLGHEVTIVERFPSLRTSGLQLDLRGHGIEVLKRMGLESKFRAKSVPEQGLQIVDSSGRRRGFFPANRTGDGLQSFTTDYEIMRGDFCRLLYDETKDSANYRFDTFIDAFDQDEDSVQVRFNNGQIEKFDILVGADGSMSRTRRMMLGSNKKDAFLPLDGLVTGYFAINRPIKPGEEYIATLYTGTNRRGVMTRRANPDELQIYIGGRVDPKVLDNVRRGDVVQEKRFLAEYLKGAGWEVPEYVEAMKTTDNFYCERLGIVQLDSWSNSRVTLVGDAAHCPSATTGMGTTSAVTGAYILAGELSRALTKECTSSPGTGAQSAKLVASAFHSYQEKFEPFMKQVMRGLAEGNDPYSMMPTSSFGIGVMHLIVGVVSFLRLDLFASKLLREKVDDWSLPTYEEMDQTIQK